MHPAIDLNADLGEGFGHSRLTEDEALLDLVSSANIACGFHAGDATTMRDTVRAAKSRGVTIGAHPSYPDVPGFGRRELGLSPKQIRFHVASQLRALRDVCAGEGAKLSYVKPHGALYNRAAKDSRVADAIVQAISDVEARLLLLGLAGSEMARAAEQGGVAFAAEAFADRAYNSDGSLVPRSEPGAVIHDVQAAVERAITLTPGSPSHRDRRAHGPLCCGGTSGRCPRISSSRTRQARRGAVRRQGLRLRRRSGSRRAGCQDRHGSMDFGDRRQQIRLLHHACASDRGRKSFGGRLGRRIRNPRLCRGLRCRDRQGSLAHVHRARSRRARQRDLAGRRPMENRRRPVWVTGNYDPETNLAFWGTGNGGPWMGDQRPGDNLYTASTIAFDVATGAIKGYHQYHPNDSWDWDEVAADSGRLPAQRAHHQGPDRRRARRLSLVSRAQRRADQVRRRQAVRESERVQEPRSEDRTARHRSGAQAGHR